MRSHRPRRRRERPRISESDPTPDTAQCGRDRAMLGRRATFSYVSFEEFSGFRALGRAGRGRRLGLPRQFSGFSCQVQGAAVDLPRAPRRPVGVSDVCKGRGPQRVNMRAFNGNALCVG